MNIQIPKPCAQSWDEMTPEAGGRHCAACAKTVTDFTRMSDAQVLDVLRNSAGGCGRFNTDQLDRELIAPLAESRFSFAEFYKLATSLLLVFSAGRVAAQEKIEIHVQDKKQQQQNIGDSTVISGTVRDGTGESLLGAIIRIDGTQLGVISGINGDFKLKIANSFFREGVAKCTVYNVGFEDYYFNVFQNESSKILEIVLEPPTLKSTRIKGETITITAGRIRVAQPKKWWQFWKRH